MILHFLQFFARFGVLILLCIGAAGGVAGVLLQVRATRRQHAARQRETQQQREAARWERLMDGLGWNGSREVVKH